MGLPCPQLPLGLCWTLGPGCVCLRCGVGCSRAFPRRATAPGLQIPQPLEVVRPSKRETAVLPGRSSVELEAGSGVPRRPRPEVRPLRAAAVGGFRATAGEAASPRPRVRAGFEGFDDSGVVGSGDLVLILMAGGAAHSRGGWRGSWTAGGASIQVDWGQAVLRGPRIPPGSHTGPGQPSGGACSPRWPRERPWNGRGPSARALPDPLSPAPGGDPPPARPIDHHPHCC